MIEPMTRISGDVLDGVSATTLWTLHNRGTEATRAHGMITDPWAVTLFDSIGYDYRKFGKPNESHALRARAFDRAATDYLSVHPRATVVALAEGLQTSFWRLDAAGVADQLTWCSIDLPPVMALRRQLLPHDPRIVELTQSALDRGWMDAINGSDGVFVTAEGLLMYLEPDDAHGLIADCATRFPGGQMIFDSIPHWLSRRTLKGLDRIGWLRTRPAQHHAVGVRMTTYAAFLRGVNVGGVNLKMADVARAFEDVGFKNVRTILASGNAVLDSSAQVAAVRKKAEAALREAFGYDAWVLAYDLDTVRAIVDDYPFEPEVADHHSYVTFVSDPDVLAELAALTPGPENRSPPGTG